MSITPVSLNLYDRDFDAFAEGLGQAFERYGFAVVADHGLPDALVNGALSDTRAFFALPDAMKMQYFVEGGAGQRGYTPFGIETAKGEAKPDLKEFWHVGRDLPLGHPYAPDMPANLWPAEIPGFHQHVKGLFDALDTLGVRVLRAVARHLGLDIDFFDAPVKDGNSVLRLLHYPPVSPTAEGLRAGAHEDINVITLLLGAEEAGLQILDRDGQWLDIRPPEGAIVCNIGDMLQRLTNHVLPSTSHRVINPAPERRGHSRYSTPFFLHFAPDYPIRTLPGCISAKNPDRYPQGITSNQYLIERLQELKLLK